MNTFHFKRWEIAYDREATLKALDGFTGDPELCGCEDCRNFITAEPYPEEVLSLFQTLGIHPYRASEFYREMRIAPGLHLYGGWFHFVGSIVSGKDAKQPLSENSWAHELEAVNDSFALGFTSQLELVPVSFPSAPLVQLEIEARVPWVIDVTESLE